MSLFLDVGRSEQSARRGAPMGSSLTFIPEGADVARGVLLACAEGLPGRPEPEQAARTALTMLGDTYVGAIQTFEARDALEQSLAAAHQAVVLTGGNARAAVVTALVLAGRHWLLAHAGNGRAWLYRDLQLKQLTHDHVVPRPTQQPEITRACGLGQHIDAEYTSGALAQGDVLAITSPGVHAVLAAPMIMGILQQTDSTAQQMADAIVRAAVAARATGYVAVCVARIERLPAESGVRDRDRTAALPVVAPPEIGTTVDAFLIEKIAHTSRRFRLYQAVDQESKKEVLLKFPNPSYYEDPKSVQTFLREEWIGRRIDSPYVLKTIVLRPGRRTALYSVMEYRDGENLAKRIRRKEALELSEALRLGEQLLTALEALHSQGVIHRDVRPNNIIYDTDSDEVRLLGLGTDYWRTLSEHDSELSTNAVNYLAPEILQGSPATVSSDLYSAGITLYYMLTGAYPYGKIRSPQDVRRQDYASVQRHKTTLPVVLDQLLRRACALDPKDRFTSAEQFMAALAMACTTINAEARPSPVGDTKTFNRWHTWLIVGGLVAAFLAYLYIALGDR
jgi:hypothetical protein